MQGACACRGYAENVMRQKYAGKRQICVLGNLALLNAQNGDTNEWSTIQSQGTVMVAFHQPGFTAPKQYT
jgi:hypothetical protein